MTKLQHLLNLYNINILELEGDRAIKIMLLLKCYMQRHGIVLPDNSSIHFFVDIANPARLDFQNFCVLCEQHLEWSEDTVSLTLKLAS